MNEIVTTDLSKFGRMELEAAKKLLDAYLNHDETEYFFNERGVSIAFNTHSGKVFLTNEEYQVAVEEDGKLVDWFMCTECGYEGTRKDYMFDKKNGNVNDCCAEYFFE